MRTRELGLTPRKSLRLGFPALAQALEPHFIRGYFDGNGTVFTGRPDRLISGFDGPRPLLDDLQRILVAGAAVRLNRILRNGPIWRLRFNHGDSIRVARFMYEHGGPCLARKRDRFVAAGALVIT